MTRFAWFVAFLVGCSASHAPPPLAAPTPTPTPPPTTIACAAHPAPALDAGVADDDYPTDGARVATSDDRCAVADSNLTRVENALLALPAPPPAETARAAGKPARLDLVAHRLALSKDELAALARNGFVVPARLAQSSYAFAFHELYQSQLPIYISVDAIFHAVYAAHDSLLADLERRTLAPLLDDALATMHCSLASAAAAGTYPPEISRDLDVYLTVARSLLADHALPSALGDTSVDAEAAALLAQAHEASALAEVTLFGRQRMIDWSQFGPRGHYTTDLAPYFRAVMWTSRLELNLVSRSSRSSQPGDSPDPTETPREDVLALALADLATRSGAAPRIAKLDRAFELFAGRREDLSITDLTLLRQQAGLDDLRAPDAAARLRAAIGTRWKRTAQLHYMPQGSTELPAISTLLGPRVVADTAAVRPIVHSAIPERHRLSGADFAAILGSDRALTYLADDLRAFPGLAAGLNQARLVIDVLDLGDNVEPDLYASWLIAIHGLAARPAGTRPSYMDGVAFADLRVDSMVAAYAQLRHGNLLLAGQAYDEGGCEIPDGWVDPAPAVYRALADYAARGERAVAELDPKDPSGARAYFQRLGRVMRVLGAISAIELAGQPLPPDALRFLSMVSEMSPGSTGGPPTYTGWYFNLFQHRQDDGLRGADLVADVYTSSEAGITYLGASAPRLGVFVVDTGGAPRVVVGPVARAWQHQGPIGVRLDDEAAAALPAAERVEPWAASYAIAASVEPALTATYEQPEHGPDVVVVQATAAVGPVTIELLDHHRRPVAHQTHTVGAGKTRFVFPRDQKKPWQAIAVHAGAAHAWGDVSDTCSCANVSLGGGGDPEH